MEEHHGKAGLCAAPLAVGFALLAASDVAAQEKCRISWEVSPADSKYIQQHSIDAGDVPDHRIRVYELRRAFSNETPNCEELRRTEEWTRGFSDYTSRNGQS
jgi:hypothetical protein